MHVCVCMWHYMNSRGIQLYVSLMTAECGPGLEFECTPARWIFPVAFAVYMVLAAILLLSMLIAVIRLVIYWH